jgi:hypothetical protein
MGRPFGQLTLGQFSQLLQSFQFTREIDVVHMHTRGDQTVPCTKG